MALNGLFGLCSGVENNLTFLLFGVRVGVGFEPGPNIFSSSESSMSWKSGCVSTRFGVLNFFLKNDLKQTHFVTNIFTERVHLASLKSNLNT